VRSSRKRRLGFPAGEEVSHAAAGKDDLVFLLGRTFRAQQQEKGFLTVCSFYFGELQRAVNDETIPSKY